MDKVSHFGSIIPLIKRNAEAGRTCGKDGKRDLRLQAKKQLEQLKTVMRTLLLIALGKIGTIEKEVKSTLINNMLLFEKYPETSLELMGNKLKEAIKEAAILACDSHPVVGKAEFSILCMKFGNNKAV